MEDVEPTVSDGNSSESDDDHHNRVDGGGRGVDESNKESPDEGNANPNQPNWRGRNCDLLNDDMSFFGRAKIVVCLRDELFDEKNLGDTDVGVLFLAEGDLQMTSFRWPLAQVCLEGGDCYWRLSRGVLSMPNPLEMILDSKNSQRTHIVM